MKQSTIQSCCIVALLALALSATPLQAQNMTMGRIFLKAEAYSEAYAEFLKETQINPKDPEAQTLAALANILDTTRSKGFNDFLNLLSFDKNGRKLGAWTSTINTEALEERLKLEELNGQKFKDFIQNELISKLKKSLNHFEAIPAGKSFLIFLSEQETQISDVYLDQGDVTMLEAALQLICFGLEGLTAQNMHVDVKSILDLLNDEMSVDAFLSFNQNFMKDVSPENIKAARSSFVGFIDNYTDGSKRLQNRTTGHLNHLISINEDQKELEAEFREHLSHLRFEESLNSLFKIEIEESTVTFSADPVRLFETPLRSFTRADSLVGVIRQEAEQMVTRLDLEIEELSNISRARIIKPLIDTGGRLPDGADILLLQGGFELAHSLLAVLSAHDLNVDLQEIVKLRNEGKLDIQNILTTKETILNLDSPQVMLQARGWLAGMRQNLKEGYSLLQSRRDGKIGILFPSETLLEKTIEALDIALASEIKAHELSGAFLKAKYRINTDPLWGGKINIKNLLPNFNANDPVPGTLPDSAIAGLFPDKIYINNESRIEKLRLPYFLEQPKNTYAQLGEKVTFLIKISGPGTLEYQWYKNGQMIPNANELILVIENTQERDYGTYSVWVKNSVGKTYSQIATLTPVKPVVGSIQVNIQNNTSLPFTVSFSAKSGLSYEFQSSGDLKNWSKVEEINGTGGEVKVTDLREAIFQKQYYRVKLVE